MSISVWPGYVAAVASLLLSLLLLAGVLVVSMSQVGRVVGAYNKQLLSAVAEDERRQVELEQVRSELAKKAAAMASQPSPSAQALPADSLQALENQLRLKSAEVASAESELLRLQSQVRQLATPVREGPPLRTYRFVFGPGAQGLDAQAIKELAASLRGQEALSSGWLLESGVRGLDAVVSREIFRLMLGVREQLRDLGLKTEQVRVLLHQDRGLLDAPGLAGPPPGAGDVVILLRAEAGRRP